MLLLTRASVLAMTIAATAAGAQTQSPDGAAATAATAPTAPDGIADIVVTAQRRAEPLQKAALAVSAVDGAALRNAGVSQPQDLTKLIPASACAVGRRRHAGYDPRRRQFRAVSLFGARCCDQL